MATWRGQSVARGTWRPRINCWQAPLCATIDKLKMAAGPGRFLLRRRLDFCAIVWGRDHAGRGWSKMMSVARDARRNDEWRLASVCMTCALSSSYQHFIFTVLGINLNWSYIILVLINCNAGYNYVLTFTQPPPPPIPSIFTTKYASVSNCCLCQCMCDYVGQWLVYAFKVKQLYSSETQYISLNTVFLLLFWIETFCSWPPQGWLYFAHTSTVP